MFLGGNCFESWIPWHLTCFYPSGTFKDLLFVSSVLFSTIVLGTQPFQSGNLYPSLLGRNIFFFGDCLPYIFSVSILSRTLNIGFPCLALKFSYVSPLAPICLSFYSTFWEISSLFISLLLIFLFVAWTFLFKITPWSCFLVTDLLTPLRILSIDFVNLFLPVWVVPSKLPFLLPFVCFLFWSLSH